MMKISKVNVIEGLVLVAIVTFLSVALVNCSRNHTLNRIKWHMKYNCYPTDTLLGDERMFRCPGNPYQPTVWEDTDFKIK